MEKKNIKLKNNFTQFFSQVSKLYTETNNSNNESFLLGKKAAYEEILNWFVTSHNGELKYVSSAAFFSFIQEKIVKTKGALAATGNDEEEETTGSKPVLNFSEIKLSDNRKRINRYAQEQNDMVEDNNNNQIASNSNNFPTLNNAFSNNIQMSNSNHSGTIQGMANINPLELFTNINSNNTMINSNTLLNNLGDISINNSNIPFSNAQPGLFMPTKKKKFK